MKNNKINLKTIIIIGLIVIIISLICIILNMKNKNIEGQKIIKEQLEELATDNSYISLSTHMLALDEKQKEINNIQNTAGQATATEDKILKDYTAYKNGKLITGTMTNNGAISSTLNAGENYTIPAGYHNGNGKVTTNSLASQTSATATAADIASGKTAYVNGIKITGTKQSINGPLTAVHVGNSSDGIATINISGRTDIPDYKTLTTNNIKMVVTGMYHRIYGSWDSQNSGETRPVSYSYDASTGVISCNAYYKAGGSRVMWLNYSVYVVY